MRKTGIGILFSLLLILFTSFTSFGEVKEQNVKTNKTGSYQNVNYFNTTTPVTAPVNYATPFSEMRGVWVSTVYNESMPRQLSLDEAGINTWKAEFIQILDRMSEFGMNTLYFQIRPANDAFYESTLNPWSTYLYQAGVNPGWDPLSWMIEQTHNRGYRFVGWLNAFRVTTSSILPDASKNSSYYSNDSLVQRKKEVLANLPDNSFAKLHPECVVLGESDSRLILNPSSRIVREFVKDSVMEIVNNYDIDGVHFDDYFYLAGGISSDVKNTSFAGGTSFNQVYTGVNCLNDLEDYELAKKEDSSLTLGDFRRGCTNALMSIISSAIKKYNKEHATYVEFGAKPAGCWQSKNLDKTDYKYSETGSNTHIGAYSSYFDLFADSLYWAQAGYIDWIAPQIYYSFDSSEVPYADIVTWWSNKIEEMNAIKRENGEKEVRLYIAQGIYKYNTSSDSYGSFTMDNEIITQLKFNQKFSTIKGSAVYSYLAMHYFNTENAKKGIGYIKRAWGSMATYPICLKSEEYNSTIDKSKVTSVLYETKNTINISFELLKDASCYGIYKVNKEDELDTSSLTQRIQVLYLDSTKLGKVELTNIDTSLYDYYIVPVSTMGNISKVGALLDLSSIDKNTAPSTSLITIDNVKVLYGATVQFFIPFAIDDSKDLSYEAYILENGKESLRKVEVTSSLVVTDGGYSLKWTAYSFDLDEAYLKVIVKDEEYATDCYSPAFTIKEKYATVPPVVPPIDDPVEDDNKKGCSCKKSMFYEISSCLLVMFVLIRKREK